jgi:hypothetical protein
VKNQFWLRGFAVSLGISGFVAMPTTELQAQYNQGLVPQSYPIAIGKYPSLAQNTQIQGGHVHVPQGNYTSTEQVQQVILGQSQDVRQMTPTPAQHVQAQQSTSQPAQVTPLPPVQSSAPAYTQSSPVYQQPAPVSAHATPMNSIPVVPQPIPMQNSVSSSCGDSAPMASIYQGVTGAYPNGNEVVYEGPVYQGGMPRAVNVNPWFFGAGALIFNREDSEDVRLSSLANPGPPVTAGAKQLSTLDVRMRTSGGFQAFGGRYFGCGRYALMGTYWGIYPSSQTLTVFDPAGVDYLRTDLPFTVQNPAGGNEHGVEMPNGAPVLGPDGGRTFYDWFTNSAAQRVVRNQDFNNVELSLFSFGLAGAARNGFSNDGGGCGGGLIGGHANGSNWQNGRFGRGSLGLGSYGDRGSCNSGCNTCQVAAPCTGPTGPCGPMTGAQCSRLRLSMLGGVRWFRYNDYLEYAASDTDTDFGGADDIYYRNTLRNDLLGFQVGGLANYCMGRKINLYASSKAGIFGNRVTFDSYAGTTTTPGVISSYSAAYDNQDYVIRSTKTGLSLLGEVETGLACRITQGITGTCGYRVVGVSGVATAPGQIPYDFSDITSIRRIQNDGSVVLHGLSFGGMYNW